MPKSYLIPILSLSILLGCNNSSSNANTFPLLPDNIQAIIPQINSNVLVNPDIGFTDLSSIHIHDDPYTPVPSYPVTSVVYYRWYWEQLEPQEGTYDFSVIDTALKDAIKHNKKLVFRIMTLAAPGETYYGDSGFDFQPILGVPCWLKDQLSSTIPSGQWEGCSTNAEFIPDYNQPYFKEKVAQLMQALGDKYDGNKNILRLDVGLVGTWGEWHLNSRTIQTSQYTDLISQDYANEELFYYVDLVEKTFPRTTKTMLINSKDEDTLSYATLKGFGWRADCLGDWAEWGWNHMEQGYPYAIEHTKGSGPYPNEYPDYEFDHRWQQKPVDFEICETMEDWSYNPELYTQEKVKESFDYALKKHASLINAKSKKIPDMYQGIVQDTLKKLGYRFELTQLLLPITAHAGERIKLVSQWQNVGVAPSYNNYPIRWRLRSVSSDSTIEFETNTDITLWQPAEELNSQAPSYEITNELSLPSTLAIGKYYIDVALVDPETNQPKILLGIDGAMKDRWHELATITISN
ncbi:TPA: DUF4832 domain-containing protein [Photobacterium damselae]